MREIVFDTKQKKALNAIRDCETAVRTMEHVKVCCKRNPESNKLFLSLRQSLTTDRKRNSSEITGRVSLLKLCMRYTKGVSNTVTLRDITQPHHNRELA